MVLQAVTPAVDARFRQIIACLANRTAQIRVGEPNLPKSDAGVCCCEMVGECRQGSRFLEWVRNGFPLNGVRVQTARRKRRCKMIWNGMQALVGGSANRLSLADITELCMRKHRTGNANTIEKETRTEPPTQRIVAQDIVDDSPTKRIVPVFCHLFPYGRWIEIYDG